MPSERIRDQLNPLVIARGDVYAAGGRVTLIGADPDFVGAIVRGSVPYDVTLRYELRGGTVPTLVMSCMCAAAPRGPCKHVWAALRVAERSGHLANASRAPGHLAIGLAGPDPPYGGGPEVRWVIDLTSSRGHSAVPIDVYERAASGLGFSTGFRKVTLRRRSFDPRLVPGGTLADLVALARTGRCDVRSAHDEPASALVVDEGAPFAVVLTVDGAGTIDGGMPALAVRGSLRREGEELSLGALSGIYDSGVAFLGPRAVRIECDVPLRWVDAIREQGELLVPAEESVPFLRELLRRCRCRRSSSTAASPSTRDRPSWLGCRSIGPTQRCGRRCASSWQTWRSTTAERRHPGTTADASRSSQPGNGWSCEISTASSARSPSSSRPGSTARAARTRHGAR